MEIVGKTGLLRLVGKNDGQTALEQLSPPVIALPTAFNKVMKTDASGIGYRQLTAPTIELPTAFNKVMKTDASGIGYRQLSAPTIGLPTAFNKVMGLAPIPEPACLFEFSLTDAEAIGLGMNGALTPSNSGKTVTGTLTGTTIGLISTKTGINIPPPVGYPIVENSNPNIISMECEVTLPILVDDSDRLGIDLFVQLIDPVTSGVCALVLNRNGGDWELALTPTSLSLGTGGVFKFSLDVDISTSNYWINYNSVEYAQTGLSFAGSTGIILLAQMNAVYTTPVPSDNGKEIVLTLTQDSDDFTLPHKAGALDLCSQFIGNP